MDLFHLLSGTTARLLSITAYWHLLNVQVAASGTKGPGLGTNGSALFSYLSVCLPAFLCNLSFQPSACMPARPSIYLPVDLQSFCWTLAPFFQFPNLYTSVGLLGRMISRSQGLYLYTGQHKHRAKAHTNIHASRFSDDSPFILRYINIIVN
jgi:hypothetical protein